jgi:hypothetical protein
MIRLAIMKALHHESAAAAVAAIFSICSCTGS